MTSWLSEMPKEAWAGVGAVIASLITYFVNRLSTRTQLRIAEIQANKDLRIHRERVLADVEGRRENRMLERLESAHQVLAEVSMSFSLTGMHFTEEDKISVEEFREWYLGYCRKVECILSHVSFYLPQATKLMQDLYGRMNVYWGEMEGLIIAHKEGKRELWEARRDGAYQASREIGDKSLQIRRLIETTAHPAAAPNGMRRD